LGAEEQRAQSVDQERPRVYRIERRRIEQAIDPRESQVHHAEETEQKANKPDAAEQMLAPLPEAGEKLDGHEVRTPFDKAADAVLGLAKAAWAMVNVDLSDVKAARRREHGNEAM